MENTILWYNNSLSFSLKQTMNNINDLIYNIQNLKQLQLKIDECQNLKDGIQLQTNMACLALLRRYILDEVGVGSVLFRNLIRKYYPLGDEQIVKYETSVYPQSHKIVEERKFVIDPRNWYNITNLNVLRRKGPTFSIDNNLYCAYFKYYRTTVKSYNIVYSTVITEILSLDELFRSGKLEDERIISRGRELMDFFRYNYYVDFHNSLNDPRSAYYLVKNEFTKWSWDLVKEIIDKEGPYSRLSYLLQNNGFFAQMGIGNIVETLTRLQELLKNTISKDVWNEVVDRYKNMGIKLYSYSPDISKNFIIEHQDELDWLVLQRNPYIQWDLELINIFLRRYKMLIPEYEWEVQLGGSHAMYYAIEDFLNDSILNDIEKLYRQ